LVSIPNPERSAVTPCKIPFNKPSLTGNELQYIAEAIRAGHSAGDGQFTKRCHRYLETELGVGKALLTTSCTHALEMAALLLDIQPGDEVIVPAFTFVSTVNAFVLRGATPVFADIRPDTLNMDEAQVGRLITSRTKAIVPVHYAGVGCEMDTIVAAAARDGVAVVEDNAHGLFGRYRGRYLGTIGALATQSFHETKNFICGEGGALIVNDARYADRAEIIREKGTNRSRFFRGQVDKYTWVDIGSSYLPSDILAAFLMAQLECRAQVQEKRRRIWERYYEQLGGWARDNGVQLPFVPQWCEQPYHMFYMLMPSLEDRQGMIAYLKEQGILSVFHYLPLHLSDMGRHFGGKPGDCPVTEDVSDRLLRLPFYNELTEAEQTAVIEAIKNYRGLKLWPEAARGAAEATTA
jgi:dTDP-4-amino-4,6-dideoxygalactose transaminase